MDEAAITLKIHLLPRASRNEICGLHGDAIKVKVTAPPIEGKANLWGEEIYFAIPVKTGLEQESREVVST